MYVCTSCELVHVLERRKKERGDCREYAPLVKPGRQYRPSDQLPTPSLWGSNKLETWQSYIYACITTDTEYNHVNGSESELPVCTESTQANGC